MKRELSGWYSPALQKEMPIAAYGDYGFALLLVPTAAADYLEYERFQLMETLAPFIDSGKVRIFSVNSINNESWLNNEMEGAHKAIRQNQFNNYIFDGEYILLAEDGSVMDDNGFPIVQFINEVVVPFQSMPVQE